jgi:RNA polymerase sigma-70 factor (ECF subfamily)
MDDLQQLDDGELIESFLQGDENAFEELVRRYESQVYNLAYRLLGNPSDAFDASQEVFILLFRKLGTFRSEARFSTWLYRVTTNACRDFRRRRKYALSLSGKGEEGEPEWEEVIPGRDINPDELLVRLELQKEVQSAIGRLPEKFREMVVLHDIEGYNYAEVSEILGISLGTVKSRLNRARRRLAADLKVIMEPPATGGSSKDVEEGEGIQEGGPPEAVRSKSPERKERG